MSSGVSLQANPNIIPWSPAPCCPSNSLSPAPDTPWEYPAKMRISYTGHGYRLEGYYTSNILFDVTDIFAEIPAIIRNFLLTFMARPVYIINLGEFNGYLIQPDGRVETLLLYGPYEYLLAK